MLARDNRFVGPKTEKKEDDKIERDGVTDFSRTVY